MNILHATRSNSYDAIVIGSGISGGWAAMELCRKGLKTLVLERGRDVEHIRDYPTATFKPWDFKFGLNNTELDRKNDPVQSQFYDPGNKHFFVRDNENPYVQEKPFDWYRGYQVGGRSLTWGRQCYRLSDLDFEANLKDGIGVDWPIRYKDMERWYEYVENFVGVSGQRENLKHLPDGEFLPPMDLNCIEKHLAQSIRSSKEKRILTIARVANLTKGWIGRGPCVNRNLCSRGCPNGGYFSSNSSTLPVAASTGNLTMRPFSVAVEVMYDEQTNKASGVRIIDTLTNEEHFFFSKIIFINASTIATAAILLNSKSARFPYGLGNNCKQVGHNLMDHHSSAGAYGTFEGYQDRYYRGTRPCGFFIPRYRNLTDKSDANFVRGYNLQGRGDRHEWKDKVSYLQGFGRGFKDSLMQPGPWAVWLSGYGECLPYYDNRISLDSANTDKWGMPLIRVNFSFRDNEERMMKDIQHTSKDMLEKAGFKDVTVLNYRKNGGASKHEMGTARMGIDSTTSVLNKNNQLHDVKNVFITDGSCMTSSACQNPSLTYMALTARACDYAVRQLSSGNL